MAIRLAHTALRRRYDAATLGFATTADMPDDVPPVGQPRAVAAIELGARMASAGFNIFAFGAPGTARRDLLTRLLGARAAERAVPNDICYVQNFDESFRPHLLLVPAGKGRDLRSDMASLVTELRSALTAAFESDDYRRRHEAIDRDVKGRSSKQLHDLGERARAEGLALIAGPMGFILVPIRGDEPLPEEEFDKLPDEEKARLREKMRVLQEELAELLRHVPAWERERGRRVRELDRDVVKNAVGQLVDEIRSKYDEMPAVTAHVDRVERDLLEHARALLEDNEGELPDEPGEMVNPGHQHRRGLRRYEVNLLVDNSTRTGAPVVFEENPTYENLVGHIDHVARFGALVTDFTLIRPGALHRAQGGYLVLDALRVLHSPYAWDGLKLALRSGELRVEPLSRLIGLGTSIALEPEPLDLDVRVALVGEPWLYYLVCEHDPEFRDLFKVPADFADDVESSDEVRPRYVELLAAQAKRDALLPFDATGIARILEESARLAGSQERLSMRMDDLGDLMKEADHLARAAGASSVGVADVEHAIEARTYRRDRMRERLRDETIKGTIIIDTSGAVIGQVNGLSVIPLAEFAFGRPSRITARVRVGEGKVVDIEREVELGGPIHSKGVLILDAFLAGRYALKTPLSLHASLVFEQSYSAVEGDSASAAELFALLSALASVPLSQRIAVTGSVNQRGDVQPVGGINEKIEGFFDLCRARGLTGEQGVLIPEANVRHLMLRPDVVDAVEAGKFHVHTMRSIDDGLELLTGLPAGERNEAGEFPAGSVNQLVELQLEDYAGRRRAFDAPITAELVLADDESAAQPS